MKKSLLLLSFLLLPLVTRGKVTSTPLFEVSYEAPIALSICNNSLWIVTANDNSLHIASPDSGEKIKTLPITSLDSALVPTALGCHKGKILLAGALSKEKNALFEISFSGTSFKHRSLKIPSKGHPRDIYCNEARCLVTQDSLFETSDLDKWFPYEFPPSTQIDKFRERKTKTPFDGWQDKNAINEGRYFRPLINSSGELFILDAYSSALAYRQNLTDANSTTYKWGRWGTWEGTLMYPKGLSLLEEDNIVLISDVGLRLVFAFDKKGNYQGKIGSGEENTPFFYPNDIDVKGKRIYITDFLANKVIAKDIGDITPEKIEKADDVKELLSKNLFHQKEINADFSKRRCLNCHDGLEAINYTKFMNLKNHHPIDVPYTGDMKIDLPLESGKNISCSTCHNQHHVGTMNEKEKEMIPFFLRKTPLQLCLTCHKDKTERSNHMVPTDKPTSSAEQADDCFMCHSVHAAETTLLKQEGNALCIECHTSDFEPKHSMKECNICHQLHTPVRNTKLSKSTDKDPNQTCLMCHAQFAPVIGKVSHFSDKMKDMRRKVKWPGDESTCIQCHFPHGPQPTVNKLCASCHTKRYVKHIAMNDIVKTQRAEGIKFSDGKIVCSTCHNQHGIDSDGGTIRFLKPKDPLIKFCSSCHGPQASSIYNNFHIRLKKKVP